MHVCPSTMDGPPPLLLPCVGCKQQQLAGNFACHLLLPAPFPCSHSLTLREDMSNTTYGVARVAWAEKMGWARVFKELCLRTATDGDIYGCYFPPHAPHALLLFITYLLLCRSCTHLLQLWGAKWWPACREKWVEAMVPHSF